MAFPLTGSAKTSPTVKKTLPSSLARPVTYSGWPDWPDQTAFAQRTVLVSRTGGSAGGSAGPTVPTTGQIWPRGQGL